MPKAASAADKDDEAAEVATAVLAPAPTVVTRAIIMARMLFCPAGVPLGSDFLPPPPPPVLARGLAAAGAVAADSGSTAAAAGADLARPLPLPAAPALAAPLFRPLPPPPFTFAIEAVSAAAALEDDAESPSVAAAAAADEEEEALLRPRLVPALAGAAAVGRELELLLQAVYWSEPGIAVSAALLQLATALLVFDALPPSPDCASPVVVVMSNVTLRSARPMLLRRLRFLLIVAPPASSTAAAASSLSPKGLIPEPDEALNAAAPDCAADDEEAKPSTNPLLSEVAEYADAVRFSREPFGGFTVLKLVSGAAAAAP